MAAAALVLSPTPSASMLPDPGQPQLQLFSSSERLALDGFFDAQLEPSSSSRSIISHPRPAPPPSQVPAPANAIQRTPSPYTFENTDSRDRRLKLQAQELAAWFSRSQAGFGTFSGLAAAPPPGPDVPALYHGHQGSGPSSSSASSTSNSENLPTHVHPPHIQQYTNLHPQSHHPVRSTEYLVDDLVAPQAKRPKSSILPATASPETVPVPPTDHAASLRPTATETRGRAKAHALSHSTARKRPSSNNTCTSARRNSSSSKRAQLNAFRDPAEGSTLIASSSTLRSPSIADAPGAGPPKAVLTDAQKKANHIASEQKRRTAIRSAYDDLCNIVPALRAAVQEYEERLSKLHGLHAASEQSQARKGEEDGPQQHPPPPPLTVAGVLTGGIEVGGEKVDGRAGPKSEAIVLGKTVEYLNQLLEQREGLLARMQTLRDESRARGIKIQSLNVAAEEAPWSAKWRNFA
ncbi:MAG: hypothetical protein CYPHOPRED_004397 [Cyphobasidiales sp. Tagirdzhanova-0007]|nr:MAG: hypothetical protein CYPHOPRED_004397 [Cyphobasidiales sp. Tagirdzhanova-0007]